MIGSIVLSFPDPQSGHKAPTLVSAPQHNASVVIPPLCLCPDRTRPCPDKRHVWDEEVVWEAELGARWRLQQQCRVRPQTLSLHSPSPAPQLAGAEPERQEGNRNPQTGLTLAAEFRESVVSCVWSRGPETRPEQTGPTGVCVSAVSVCVCLRFVSPSE